MKKGRKNIPKNESAAVGVQVADPPLSGNEDKVVAKGLNGWIVLISYSLITLFPLIFGNIQLLAGTVVNSMLALLALRGNLLTVIPAIFVPSISLLLGSMLIGFEYDMLIYFVPAIWFANLAFVYGLQLFTRQMKLNNFISLMLAVFIKSAILLSAAVIFNAYIAASFALVYIGIVQIITGINGGLVAFLLDGEID